MNSKIARNLEALRKKNNLTQEALAEKLGVSRQTVSNWEQGTGSPDIDHLMALAKLYNVKVDDLLEPADKQTDFEQKRESFFGMGIGEDKPKKPASRAASFPFPVLVVIAYFIIVYTTKVWHPTWLVFLTIPIYYYIVNWVSQLKDKDNNHALALFPFPLLIVIAYLLIGFIANVWHPTWIIFLTIPVYFYIVEVIKKRGTRANPLTYVSFPVLVTIVFLLLGFLADAWSWAWIVFLTIPIWGWLVKNVIATDENSYKEDK